MMTVLKSRKNGFCPGFGRIRSVIPKLIKEKISENCWDDLNGELGAA